MLISAIVPVSTGCVMIFTKFDEKGDLFEKSLFGKVGVADNTKNPLAEHTLLTNSKLASFEQLQNMTHVRRYKTDCSKLDLQFNDPLPEVMERIEEEIQVQAPGIKN